MYLHTLSLINFKNIEQENLSLSPDINCLVGDNGAGKTNVIDAVYYLSMCKSALGMTDGQSIRHGEEFFMIEGGSPSGLETGGSSGRAPWRCLRKFGVFRNVARDRF